MKTQSAGQSGRPHWGETAMKCTLLGIILAILIEALLPKQKRKEAAKALRSIGIRLPH